jgi:hypothetical protein
MVDFNYALCCAFGCGLDSFVFVLHHSSLSAERCYGTFDSDFRAVTSITLEEMIQLLTSSLLEAVRKYSMAYS